MYISLQLDKQFIPADFYIPADFLIDDISVEAEPHLVFATTKQLELLACLWTLRMRIDTQADDSVCN